MHHNLDERNWGKDFKFIIINTSNLFGREDFGDELKSVVLIFS